MLTLISLALMAFGGLCVSLAFKPGSRKMAALVAGAALISLGGYLLPEQVRDAPDVYYRK